MSKIIGTNKENKILIFKYGNLVLCLKENEFDGFDVFITQTPVVQSKIVLFYEYTYHIRIHKKSYSFVIDIDNEEDFNEYVSILSKSI